MSVEVFEVAGSASVESSFGIFSNDTFNEPSDLALFEAGEKACLELKTRDNLSMALSKVVVSTSSAPSDSVSVVYDFADETDVIESAPGKIDFG
eukprot:9477419-Pyramimonas_sp.AAC.1